MSLRKVTVDGIARLPAFCHATIAGNQVLVSGILGVRPGTMDLVEGGVRPETTQTLANITTILRACGCEISDVAKVNVYLTDMTQFLTMNEAYVAAVGSDPPARITVGCTALALGATVEMDCIAFLPDVG